MSERFSISSSDTFAQVKSAVEDLLKTQEEFPIQVAGVNTTPYAAVVGELDLDKRQFLLKLIRPLPHELPEGALFRVIFGVSGERFEAPLVFRGREAYLLYRFDLPEKLEQAGRRKYKRFPFRPREKVFVVAQDGAVPGLGVAGPLANLSQGGLAMRLDRIVRLDDGMRLPLGTSHFERGRAFPMLWVQDLPGLPSLHARGVLAHVMERGSEITLAFEFTQMSDGDAKALAEVLALRASLTGPARGLGAGTGSVRIPSPTESGKLIVERDEDQEAPLPPELDLQESIPEPEEVRPLLRLARRTLRLGLGMAPGPRRDALEASLLAEGFGRLELLDDLGAVRAASNREPADRRPGLLALDLMLGGPAGEPLAALRVLEREMHAWSVIPLVVLCEEDDPSLLLGRDGLTLAMVGDGLGAATGEGAAARDWHRILDRKAQLPS